MSLSSDLIAQFVKVTKDQEPKSHESTVYGTTVLYNGKQYVRIDGSDLLTPVNSTATVTDGERVTVLIKDHTATVTGNLSNPSASSSTVTEIGNQISEFEIIIADKVSTKELDAEKARIDELRADNVTIKGKLDANEASIKTLTADNVTIKEKLTAAEASIGELETTKLDAEVADITYATIKNLEATNAQIYNLNSVYGDFEVLTTDKFVSLDATIAELETKKLSAEAADLKYANIDFANIGKAAIENFFSKSGMIGDLVVGEGTITGTLVGVTIKGDLIEGGTVKADKLVVKGSDGLYYKLNFEGGNFAAGEEVPTDSLHGSIITAKSITAEKVSVKDLVAFGATIGGFNITDDAIYSGAKETVDNSTRGIYLDNEGQVAFGDDSSYVKYFQDEDDKWKLEIAADSISFGSEKKDIETVFGEVEDRVFQTIDEKETSIISNSESIILSALESYVQTGDYNEFKDTVEATLTVMSDEISMNFESTSGRITDLDNEVQGQFIEMSKHISFSENGIAISSGENEMTLELDNNMVLFKKNDVLFGWWDGIDFHTGNIMIEVTERAQFGNFAFVPRSNGSLSFMKVEHRTGFYVICSGGVLFIYGAYPTLDDITMTIGTDMAYSYEGTTLTLIEGE